MQIVAQCRFTIKGVCDMIKTFFLRYKVTATTMATADRIFHSIHKIYFRRGRNAEVLYRCYFLLFLSNILLFSICGLLCYFKKA